ncbi:MAG: hypothetical protein R3E01_36180 [Pirellulaceae bacterium]|nr:hypothetical protein [Planctomycetales bacterium]
MSNSQNKPVYRKVLRGGISAAVFENTHEGRTYRSVNVQRSYRKGNDWVRMSIYLDHEHIPFMQEALDAVWKFLNNEISYGETGTTDEAATEETQQVA